MKLFRKIRSKLLKENKFGKYLLYAIGEIVLVVIGILIALSINNWSEGNKEKDVEIAILQGIRSDIIQDTIDINANMWLYDILIKKDSVILYSLTNQKEKSDTLIKMLYDISISDLMLTLHTSHYDEANQTGLAIISNQPLRSKITRLYEFVYPTILNKENDFDGLNTFKILYPEIDAFFEVDTTSLLKDDIIISDENYQHILSDKNLHYKIFEVQTMAKLLLKEYEVVKPKAIEIINLIDEELKTHKQTTHP